MFFYNFSDIEMQNKIYLLVNLDMAGETEKWLVITNHWLLFGVL